MTNFRIAVNSGIHMKAYKQRLNAITGFPRPSNYQIYCTISHIYGVYLNLYPILIPLSSRFACHSHETEFLGFRRHIVVYIVE